MAHSEYSAAAIPATASGRVCLRARPRRPVHCSRSRARQHTPYMTRQAVVDSRIMKVNTLTIDFW